MNGFLPRRDEGETSCFIFAFHVSWHLRSWTTLVSPPFLPILHNHPSNTLNILEKVLKKKETAEISDKLKAYRNMVTPHSTAPPANSSIAHLLYNLHFHQSPEAINLDIFNPCWRSSRRPTSQPANPVDLLIQSRIWRTAVYHRNKAIFGNWPLPATRQPPSPRALFSQR